MSVVALLTGFLALCVIGSLAAMAYRPTPLLWIILGCIALDAGALSFLFTYGWLR